MCSSSLQPRTHNFCLDIFKLQIVPPLVSLDAKKHLPKFVFGPSTRKLWKLLFIYKKIMKLFIYTHEAEILATYLPILHN
jgi:hypothetical protein